MASRTYNIKLNGYEDEEILCANKYGSNKPEYVLNEKELKEALYETHLNVNQAVARVTDSLMCCIASISPRTLAEAWDEENVELRVKTRRLSTLFWFTVESNEGAPSSCKIKNVSELIKRLEIKLQKEGLTKKEVDEWLEDVTPLLNASIRENDAIWVDRDLALDHFCQAIGYTRNNEEIMNTIVVPLFGSVKELCKKEESARDFNQKTRTWTGCMRSGKKADWGVVQKNWENLHQVVEKAKGLEIIIDYFSSLDNAFDPKAKNNAGFFGSLMGKKGKPSSGALALEKLFTIGVYNDDIKDDLLKRIGKSIKSASSKSPLPPVILSKFFEQLLSDNGIPLGADDSGPIFDQSCRRIGGWRSWLANQEDERWNLEELKRKLGFLDPRVVEWLDDYRQNRGIETASLDDFQIRERQIDGWAKVVKWWKKEPKADEARRIEIVREVQAECESEGDKFGDAKLFETLSSDSALLIREDSTILRIYVRAKSSEWKAQKRKIPMLRHVDAHLHPVFIEFGVSRQDIAMNFFKDNSREINAKQKAIETAIKKQDKLLVNKEKKGLSEKDSLSLKQQKNNIEKFASEKKRLNSSKGISLKIFQERKMLDKENKVQNRLSWNGFFKWSGDRFFNEIVPGAPFGDKQNIESNNVPRMSRLGLSSAKAEKSKGILSNFYSKGKPNGRLICTRRRLAKLSENELSSEKRKKLIHSLDWRLAVTADLLPEGPWKYFAEERDLLGREDIVFPPTRKELNKGRDKLGKLRYSRIPGLRILGVDLGQRTAASCAVWETLSKKQLEDLCDTHKKAKPDKNSVFHQIGEGKTKLVFRRIGSDMLPDGTTHPAPWAKLERSFVIRLQGEAEDIRLASDAEIGLVHYLEEKMKLSSPFINRLMNAGFGKVKDKSTTHSTITKQIARVARWSANNYWSERKSNSEHKYSGSIDVLSIRKELIRTYERALRRHGDIARIAHKIGASDEWDNYDIQEKEKSIASGLAKWALLSNLAIDKRSNEWKKKWEDNFSGMPPLPERVNRKTIRELESNLLDQIKSLMNDEAKRVRLQKYWLSTWNQMEEEWPEVNKKMTRWCRGKWFPGESINPQKNTGGLSLDRISMLQNIRKKQIQFNMRPTPSDLNANIPDKGDYSTRSFGQKSLDKISNLRDNRVKQLSSRIVEAALGLGKEPGLNNSGLMIGRNAVSGKGRHKPCHVVSIEYLSHYRPDQNKFRRENRGLMAWTSGKIRDSLTEQCELHSIKLNETPASYTSKFDGITGLPGVRIKLIPVSNGKFPWWMNKRLEKAQKNYSKNGDKIKQEDKLLLKAASVANESNSKLECVYLINKGGTHFISSDNESNRIVDADINAARNIAIRPILDPDWVGSWHMIPSLVEEKKIVPIVEKCKGSSCLVNFSVDRNAVIGHNNDETDVGKKRNIWSQISCQPFAERRWYTHAPFWNKVSSDCCKKLIDRLE